MANVLAFAEARGGELRKVAFEAIALAQTLAEQRPGQVSVLVRPQKQGLAAAYAEGFSWAFARGYEVVVSMDADLQHPPETIPAMISPLER